MKTLLNDAFNIVKSDIKALFSNVSGFRFIFLEIGAAWPYMLPVSLNIH